MKQRAAGDRAAGFKLHRSLQTGHWNTRCKSVARPACRQRGWRYPANHRKVAARTTSIAPTRVDEGRTVS